MQVLKIIRENIISTVIIENQIDLVTYLYCIDFDIKKLYPQSGKFLHKTKVINLYDNKVGREQL